MIKFNDGDKVNSPYGAGVIRSRKNFAKPVLYGIELTGQERTTIEGQPCYDYFPEDCLTKA